MSRKLEVMVALKCGFDMVGQGWRRAGLALAFMAVANTVFNGARGAGGPPLVVLIGFLAYMALSFMATAALLRLSTIRSANLDPAVLGAGGVQWKATETALLKLTLLILFLVLLAGLALVIVMAIVLAATGVDAAMVEQLRDQAGIEAAMTDPAMRQLLAISAVIGIVLYSLLLWLAVRLALVSAATAASGKVNLGAAWVLTKGNFWRLLGGLIVIAVPAIVISLIMNNGAQNGQMSVEQSWAFSAVLSLVSAFLIVPLQIGFTADAYRQLTEPHEGA